MHVKIGTVCEETRTQIGKGRPGKDTQYQKIVKTVALVKLHIVSMIMSML